MALHTYSPRRQDIRAVEVGLVGRLERKKVVAQDGFSLFGDLEAEVRCIVEGNTCARISCVTNECGHFSTYLDTIWR